MCSLLDYFGEIFFGLINICDLSVRGEKFFIVFLEFKPVSFIENDIGEVRSVGFPNLGCKTDDNWQVVRTFKIPFDSWNQVKGSYAYIRCC